MTLNVGLIGFGLGGATFHAAFIARTQGLRLAAIVTSSSDRRAAAQAEYPDTQIVADVDALMALDLDLVSISTPNATHFPLARRALEAGAHIVVDKPFSATSAQARELVALATAQGKLAIPFQNRRWDGDFLTLRSLIDDGTLGDVHRFESRFDRWRPVRKPGWCRPDSAETAENILHDLGTHLLDQALVLFGPVTKFYTEVKRIDPAVTTYDEMFIALTHANGVQSHLSSTMSAGIPGPRYHVFGTKASYLKHGVDVQEPQLKAGMRPETPGYGEETENLFGVVGSGGDPVPIRTIKGDYSPFYAGVAAAILHGAPQPVGSDLVIRGLEIIESALA